MTLGTASGQTINSTYDANGNTTQISSTNGTTQYTYDDADRLSAVIIQDGQGVNVSKSTFVYDGLDRLRIITKYTWDTQTSAWVQQSQKKFVYDGMQAIQERDGSDNVTATNIWDANIGGLEARIVYDVETPTNPPEKYFYHYDGSGNVSAVTDDSQTTVARYEYDAYGNIINSSGAYASQNPWRFSTKYYDSGSGLYYYGYRFYSPGLGKWINRDPIQEFGGLNLYGFVGNSPGNVADAYGHSGTALFFNLPSYAFGGAAAGYGTTSALSALGALTFPAWAAPAAVAGVGAGLAYGANRYVGNPLAKWLYPNEMSLLAPNIIAAGRREDRIIEQVLRERGYPTNHPDYRKQRERLRREIECDKIPGGRDKKHNPDLTKERIEEIADEILGSFSCPINRGRR